MCFGWARRRASARLTGNLSLSLLRNPLSFLIIYPCLFPCGRSYCSNSPLRRLSPTKVISETKTPLFSRRRRPQERPDGAFVDVVPACTFNVPTRISDGERAGVDQLHHWQTCHGVDVQYDMPSRCRHHAPAVLAKAEFAVADQQLWALGGKDEGHGAS